MDFLAVYGLPGLFIAAFLAATILPFSSEALLLLLIASTGEVAGPVIAASIGNILGSFLNYYMGRKGDSFILNKIFKMDDEAVNKARERFKKYGTYSLLLAWAPVIGDPLTVVAGVFKVNIYLFGILVSFGKIGRYVLLAYGFSLF